MRSRASVGVLTFHRCINYGSYWQARCLVDGLRQRGHDAEIIDHDCWRIKLAEWKCTLQPVLPTPVPKTDQLRYAAKLPKFGRAVAALRRSRRVDLDDPAGIAGYDRVVVGSDEVWNLQHPWYGGCALFFGDGIQARHFVAYAASFGNYDAAEGLQPAWAERLARFEAISVRDENSRAIVQQALGCKPDVVLDPCLQFPLQPEGTWRGPERPFVAVYGHNFSSAFAAAVRRWADQHHYPLLSIGYRNDWADIQWLTAGPHDFAWCFARATSVATNFFHGTVFALRNGRPFVCETTPYRAIKLQNLMDAVGGEQHLLPADAPASAYDANLGDPLDPAILEHVAGLRQASAAYLDRALA